jgi:hypothetical protein
MSTPEDFDFHFDETSHWSWEETLALPFNVI